MRNNWTCKKHKVLIAEGCPCPLCLEEKIRTKDIEKIKENERQRQTEMRKELAKIRFAEATL
jgi:deoxycytidylate deaminase